ncbi:MAG: putative family sugar kinase [Microbacteriaceae bacterium]|nr:putative family sugar kinase [Microbacteriaceae bacterium]
MTQLMEAGYLREAGQIAGSAGRPAKIISFDESRQLVLAVDLGAAHAHVALIDGGGLILMEATSSLRIDAGPDEVLRYVSRRLTELLARSGRSLSEVAGVGVGIPGPVRFTTQRPNNPPLMPGWHDFPVAQRLSDVLGLPVFVDNDANLMGLGEARARYPDSPSVLFVKVGTGIGAGVILHGQAERGVSGGAGDIGHIRIMPAGQGRLCTCGAVGCLATEASGGAVARQLMEAGIPASTPDDVARLVAENNLTAIELLQRAGRLLGDVLATSVALLNPAAVVLGGSLTASGGDRLLEAVRETVLARTVSLANRELTIARSILGSDAAVQGARHLVIDQTFSPSAIDARFEQLSANA